MPHELHCCFEKCLKGDVKRDRTAGSIRTYCYNLCWLARRMDGFGEDKVPSAEEVIKYMDENNVPLRRRQMSYSAMKVLLNAQENHEESKKYGIPLQEVKNKITSDYDKQERTDKQKANWIDYMCLKKHANELRNETVALDKNRLWTKEEYARAQLAFILTFHLKYPIRRDLCTVLYNTADNEEGNNLIGKEIVFRKHKLMKKVPEFRFQLDRKMWRLLQLLRKQHSMRNIKSGHILLNRFWRGMKPNAFTNWMKREMGKLESCKGKAVSCLGIRHSVITHRRRHDSTLHKRSEFTRCCMQSSNHMNDQYRVH